MATPHLSSLRPLLPWSVAPRTLAAITAAAVFAVAFLARLAMVYLRGGSLADSPSYDTSVYYAAADAVLHGRLPYRDFTLVHPPGIMLAITPFAALGRLTTDHTGFVVGNVAWTALGGLNAVLVLTISRRLRLGTVASVIGALGYAVWYESTRAEYSLRLEPLGNALVLLGILAFAGSTRTGSRRVSIGCGAALAAATSVKIWYAVPLVIVLAWYAVDRRHRARPGWACAGAAGTLLAVNGPFFVLAPGRMWQMVVRGQFGRSYSGNGPFRRLATIASSGQVGAHSPASSVLAVALAGAVVFVGVCALAWRSRAGRMPAALLVVELAVLMITPTFFLYYADYLAPALAITVAAAASSALRGAAPTRPRRSLLVATAWLPVVVAGGLTLGIDTVHPMLAVTPAPDTVLQASAATARCVQSDSPVALIQLDVLSRDLENGCPLWVDVIGRTYSPPLTPTGLVDGRPTSRTTYAPWQRAIEEYLLCGDAVVVVDPRDAGIARSTLEQVNRGAVLGQADGYVLRRA